jgi:hypothetical protein
MNGLLATLTIILALAVAGWASVAALRNRPPDRSHLVGLAVLEVVVIALTAAALVAVAGGQRPGEPGAFWGYVATIVCLPPIAAVLARMEPTRWGSVIVLVICLVVPVLVVRLQQTWQVTGG